MESEEGAWRAVKAVYEVVEAKSSSRLASVLEFGKVSRDSTGSYVFVCACKLKGTGKQSDGVFQLSRHSHVKEHLCQHEAKHLELVACKQGFQLFSLFNQCCLVEQRWKNVMSREFVDIRLAPMTLSWLWMRSATSLVIWRGVTKVWLKVIALCHKY